MDFFSSDVEKITGVQRLRLHNWIKAEFIKPSGQIALGHGKKNTYTLNDLYNISLFKKLIENGMHGWQASLIVGAHENIWDYEKSVNSKGVDRTILCIGLKFETGEKIPKLSPWVDIPSKKRNDVNKEVGLETRRLFDLDFDQVVLINIGKIINDVDSRI
jgi:hypothetical protein